MTAHLVELADDWRLWRWFVLRAAGFPAAILSRFAAPMTVPWSPT